MTKALFVVSAADRWTLRNGDVHPSGFWGEELAMPHKIFTEAGWEITIATPGGTPPTLDQFSMSRTAGWPSKLREVARYLNSIQSELNSPKSLEKIDPDEFDLVFYPGGHGPMEDLAVDATSGRLLVDTLASGKPLAVVCHGPAALLAATLEDGSNAFAGYRVAAFTNAEETQAGLAEKAKWLLETRLTEAGVDVRAGEPWAPNVVVDRNLVTGQNPASSAPLAAEVLKKLA